MAGLIAILGDIHANIDALDAVLEDCRREGVESYICTGDVVGYNAAPRECMDIVRGLGCPVVKGNHDHYVSADLDLSDFHPNAAAVVEHMRVSQGRPRMLVLEWECGGQRGFNHYALNFPPGDLQQYLGWLDELNRRFYHLPQLFQ